MELYCGVNMYYGRSARQTQFSMVDNTVMHTHAYMQT